MQSWICLGLCLMLMGVAACDLQGSSAKDCLMTTAKALDENDASTFVAQFDLKAYAVAEIKNLTDANEALSTLDNLGRSLGIGGMEDLLGNVFDVEHSLRKDFARKSSTGELSLRCKSASKPGCPWVAQSLREAKVTEIDREHAVARVTTPARITTWLSLAMQDKVWHIVGWAIMEETARAYALGTQEVYEQMPPKTEPKPKPEKKQHKEGISL